MAKKKVKPKRTGRKKKKQGGFFSSMTRTFWHLLVGVIFLILVVEGVIYVHDYQSSNNKEKKTLVIRQKTQSPETGKREEFRKDLSRQDEKYRVSGQSFKTGDEIPKLKVKRKEQVIRHEGYTVSYNSDYRIANWVAYELTDKEAVSKKAERSNKFVADPEVKGAMATNGDYHRSGYDRGHLAPAADMKWSVKAMRESFYMSNICPQNQKLNRDDWGDLENECRTWAKKYRNVYIVCGPIYDSSNPKRIGQHKVAVPDRFFKVVLIYNRKNPVAMGFLFENKAGHHKLEKYMVSVDSIETITGLDFFSQLPDNIEKQVEANIPTLP